MKYISLLILVSIISISTQGQSFEGKLIYTIDLQINEETSIKLGLTKELMINKLKKEGDYYDEITIYFKGGDYIKEDNSIKGKRLVYKSEENMIYFFEKDSEYVNLISGSKPITIDLFNNILPITISQSDSIKVVHGDTCKLVILNWGNLGDEYHWYAKDKINIDTQLFSHHNYDGLNKILSITNAYPMEITKSIGELMTITMTVNKIEETELDDALFQIPELRKSNRKGDRFAMKITGSNIMKIKR